MLQVIGLALAVFMLQKVAQFGQDTLLAGPALRVSQELRRRLFARLQRLDFGVLEKLSAGDLTYRLTEDADRVGEVIYKTIQDTTPSVLQLVVVFGYMVWLDWKLSIGTLLLAPLVAVLVSLFGAKVMGAAEKSQKQVSELAALLGEAISGLPLVRAFAAEPWLQQRFEVEIDLHRKASHPKLLALQYPVVGFLEAAGILAVLLMGAARIQSGDLNGQGFSSYVAALLMLIDPISHLTTNFNEFQQGQASLKRLREIEREAVEQPDRPDAQPLGRVAGELLLEQVSFGYDPQQPVLKNLSLQVKPGQVVALVGPSGAGKSTLFSLLLRFNTAQGGQVLLDGRNLADLKAGNAHSRRPGPPTKRRVLRHGRRGDRLWPPRQPPADPGGGTPRQCGRFHRSPRRLRRPRRAGQPFSGGQLQRLAIARAVLGSLTVLLLDEATSALDAEAEEAVQRGLDQAMKGRTVLVIAHRLSTVQEADSILVLETVKSSTRATMISNQPPRPIPGPLRRQLIRGA